MKLHSSGHCLILLCMAVSLTSAGEAVATTLKGTVEEIKDPPQGLQGVEVRVLDHGGKVLGEALTDPEGQFIVRGLPILATVSVRYEKKGYKEDPTIVEGVQLASEPTQVSIVNMVQSEGDTSYYEGVGKQIALLLASKQANRKQLLGLVKSLEAEKRATIDKCIEAYVEDKERVEVEKGDRALTKDRRAAKKAAKKPAGDPNMPPPRPPS